MNYKLFAFPLALLILSFGPLAHADNELCSGTGQGSCPSALETCDGGACVSNDSSCNGACGEGQACSNGSCISAGSSSAGTCPPGYQPSGYYSNGSVSSCGPNVSSSPTSNTVVPSGSVQLGGTCYVGDPNGGTSDCASGTCVNGSCTSSGSGGSTSSVTCPAGTVDEFGSCISTGTTGTVGTTGSTPTPNTSGLATYATQIQSLINTVIVPTLIALAFIVFLWGVFNYFILGADNEEKRKEGRTFVLYGVIGFVIIFSLWGIVNLVSDTVGLGGQNHPATPTL